MKEQLDERFLFLSPKEPDLDLLIFVSGCLRACALMESDPKTIPYYSITQEGDFENMISILKSCDEKGAPL